jgi:predicted phosphodiesterase
VRTAVAAVLVAALGTAGFVYRDQAYRYATHLKGSPTSTEAWEPLPTEGQDLHLVMAGDIGDSGSRLTASAVAVAALDGRQPFDGLVLLGDNVYPAGDPAGLQDTVFGPFAPVLAHAPLYAVLGNHDVMDGHGDAQAAALGMPGRWWAEHLGDVLLVGVDSTRPDDAAQRAWLERTLADAIEPWRIVLLHHPPYSAGYQGSDLAVRAAFTPLFERYGVQLVVSGHDHDYQRSVPIDGVTYVVSGGAAGSRRTGEEDFTAVSFSWHHVVELGAYADRLVVRAVNQDRRVADEATIRATPAGAEEREGQRGSALLRRLPVRQLPTLGGRHGHRHGLRLAGHPVMPEERLHPAYPGAAAQPVKRQRVWLNGPLPKPSTLMGATRKTRAGPTSSGRTDSGLWRKVPSTTSKCHTAPYLAR